jgi:putative MATE family efflux protein
MEKNRIDLMENQPVRKAILQLAIPTMLGMAVQMIYNLTDTFFVGQTGDPLLVAAISLASPIIIMLQSIGNIFANGTSSYISRRLGAKDYKEARHANAVAFYSSIGLGIIFTLTALLLKDNILSLIGTSTATLEPTGDYFTIITAFSVIMILQITMGGLIRSEGATTKAMMGMVIGIGLNIILDPIFILGLDMGIAGAAWATVIGNFFGVLYYVSHFLGKKTMLSINPRDFKPDKEIVEETIKIGVPSALSTAIMSISFVLVNVIMAGYGDHVVAGNGIEMRVVSMVVMLTMGLAQGLQPFAGYNFGAKKYHRLKEGFKVTLIYSTLLSLLFTVIFILFGSNIISLFIDDPATIEAGTTIMNAFIWCVPFFGLQFTQMITFQATGKAMKAMIISLGRQCIIFVPLLFVLNGLYGFEGVIYAQPLADIITTVIACLMSVSFMKEMSTLHDAENELNNVSVGNNEYTLAEK